MPPLLGGLNCETLTIFRSMLHELVIFVLITVFCPLLSFFFQPLSFFSLLLLTLLDAPYLRDADQGQLVLILRIEPTWERQQMDALAF